MYTVAPWTCLAAGMRNIHFLMKRSIQAIMRLWYMTMELALEPHKLCSADDRGLRPGGTDRSWHSGLPRISILHDGMGAFTSNDTSASYTFTVQNNAQVFVNVQMYEGIRR